MMGVPELGSIEEVDPREVWPDEARDFTPWLAKNLSLLGKVLGRGLKLVDKEAPVGDLSLDILARDGAGQTVAIENQLEATNHDHLGRLLIYAAGRDARIVIWVATEFKDEHRAAINRVNTWTGEEVEFYGFEVRVVKIGDSRPAPDLRLVVRPDTWSRQTRRDASPENKNQRQFNQNILDILREQGLTDYIGANLDWNSIPSKVPGFRYYWSMERKKAQPQPVAVYLEMKTGDREYEKKVFDSLESGKSDIEASLGRELIWKEKDAKKIQLILQGEEAWINDPTEKLNQIREWILEHLLKLKQIFDPRLEEIPGQSPPEKG